MPRHHAGPAEKKEEKEEALSRRRGTAQPLQRLRCPGGLGSSDIAALYST